MEAQALAPTVIARPLPVILSHMVKVRRGLSVAPAGSFRWRLTLDGVPLMFVEPGAVCECWLGWRLDRPATETMRADADALLLLDQLTAPPTDPDGERIARFERGARRAAMACVSVIILAALYAVFG